ncbi:hypothetical protein GTH32_04165 [Alteromonas sp. 345S023]|jgi:predicted small lipoprotein YifL|uniref:Lipoprotein n=1 Tax=Alteromonas profundi TaxID=2696062 RepID=A0A7X5RKH0_9ALTE|nr:lipoprotein [Alteromonas profundi]NDV90390.1 hypothetical protein [Alteromonas profundi]
MIAAFVLAFAGFFVLKKCVVLSVIAIALTGCGYKGALYIPDAPSKNTPLDTSDEAALKNKTQAPPATLGDVN